MRRVDKIKKFQDILNRLNPDDKIRAYHVAAALEKRHTSKKTPDMFFEQVKTGSSYIGKPRILDAVAIRPSWTSPCITGYEIKVDRGDFLRDEKWRDYLPYTNEFYFVAPKGVIDETELPDGIGLLIFNPNTKSVRTIKKAAWREIERSTAFDLLYFIIMWRGDSDKYKTTNTDKIEEYLAGKINAHYLGYNLRSKLLDELNEAKEKASEYERKLARTERNSEELQQIREMLLAANIGRNWDSVSARVKSLIDSRGNTLDQGLKQELIRIITSADSIKQAIGM